MVFKNLFTFVLWTKVLLASEGLNLHKKGNQYKKVHYKALDIVNRKKGVTENIDIYVQ